VPQHNLVLKIIGGTYNPIGIHTNNIKWSLDTELAEMSEFDIGIMPLPDDEWAKGKCGLKALQYMAMGIPCVASPVGVNTEIIQDGVNGFLAKDEKEWIEKLSLLIKNSELRQRLGKAGRKTVEERYSVKVWAPRYVEIIKKVIDIDKSESSIQKKIKILYLTTSSKIGGAEQVILALAKNIDHALFDIEVCILSPKGALNEELDRLKVKNFALGIKNWFYVPGAVYKLYRLLKRKQYDIINTWLFHASVMGVFITLIKTSPIIESRQYTDYMYKYNFKLKQILDRIASHNVDHIIACSNAAKEVLTHYEKVDTRKITIIYNGTNIDEFRLYNINQRRQTRENLKVEDKIVLSFTAHLRPAKGHQYLLEAISKIKNQYTNIVLLLIGEGVLRNELEALTRQLNIEDNVRFLGYRTDIPDILSATDIYVHSSVEEGFGISIIEAMAVGLPVIATNVGGIPEIITNGENGILVPPENPQALAEAISDLIEHPDKRKMFAEKGRQHITANFTNDIMAKKYMEVYRNIINQKNSVRR